MLETSDNDRSSKVFHRKNFTASYILINFSRFDFLVIFSLVQCLNIDSLAFKNRIISKLWPSKPSSSLFSTADARL